MPIGLSQNIYFANKTSGTIYVIPSPDPYWTVADVFTDAVLAFAGVTELKFAVRAAVDLPKVIKTFKDLFSYLKVAGALVGGTAATPLRTKEAAEAILDFFRQHSISIPAGGYKNVLDSGWLETWTTPSKIWSMYGVAKPITLTVTTKSGHQCAQFNTGTDYSWIATPRAIVRSRYSTVWEESPTEGSVNWESGESLEVEKLEPASLPDRRIAMSDMNTIFGTIDGVSATPEILWGSRKVSSGAYNFEVKRLGAGHFEITSNDFSGVPSVVVCLASPRKESSYSGLDNAQVELMTQTSFRVWTTDNKGAADNRPFTFIAIG